MATPPRYFQKGQFYHVYNRGTRKQPIFLSKKDYKRFLNKAKEYKDEFGITILCYCLMPNHFHFLLRQDKDFPLSVFMLRLGTSYAKYFNIKYREVGSLFQDRFKAKLIETDEYLLHLSRYIHRNPGSTPGVVLGDYYWSSYASYLKNVKDDLVNPSLILAYYSKANPSKDYKSFVEYDFNKNDLDLIKDLLID